MYASKIGAGRRRGDNIWKKTISSGNVLLLQTFEKNDVLAAEPFHLLSPGFSCPWFVLYFKHMISLSLSIHLKQNGQRSNMD